MTDAQQTADAKTGSSEAEPSGPAPVPLLAPREGVPPVTADAEAFARVVAAFAEGSGPVAVDAERASGYRYGQRAYLVQLRREGAGTALIDPIACPDFTPLNDALADTEWVLHAATQDLPCLRDIGMVPKRLFDTELAGRLAGFARVGLGLMVERVLGYSLEKGHSAADWSTRPLPEPWLRYAALDVELLVDLRDALEDELRGQGKLEWALEEFAAIAAAPPPVPRKDPWRRTSGVHRLRKRRQLAAVRELWTTRDRIAQRRDMSPTKVLPDAAIMAAALAMPADARALASVQGFGGARMNRKQLQRWQEAVDRARALPDAALPQLGQEPSSGPPPHRAWGDKAPAAAARLAAARSAVTAHAEELRLPQENLLSPEVVRRLCWEPPAPATPEAVSPVLRSLGAREWQIEQTAPLLARAIESAG
ncbi:HRDC domain-containing protein [Streptomyces sp. RFCAC02]|uniref:ribonuclease D n=1 Tax=Streptomyces sp. RFCAC02 TaxID=2499143 RepID=UPI0010218FF2|nr:HRDC domain-containing protein [Streptomyces sp. RFCAC02]